MSNLCIIPARGGSKRIPGKNVKDFLGMPIIAYSIKCALDSALFDEVMVSTDSKEIAEIAKSYGAKVPFIRSIENANDFATTMDVLEEVVAAYEEQGRMYSSVCCLYPTSPLVQTSRLKEGYELLTNDNYQTVFPVTTFSYPIWRGLELKGNTVSMLWPENETKRSQDLRSVYHDAGQWYWVKRTQIGETLFSKNSGCVVLSELEVQDIDNPSDWILAEMKYKLKNLS